MSEQTGCTVPVLVITLESSMKEVTELEAYRDHVLKGLNSGVLVFGKGVTYRIEKFPPLAGVEVHTVQGIAVDSPLLRAHDFDGTGSSDGKGKLADGATDQAVKTEILARLKTYREVHGLGCLDAVAKATRSKVITSMVLRDVILGRAVLEIKDWLKIGRALDKLEANSPKKEGADG